MNKKILGFILLLVFVLVFTSFKLKNNTNAVDSINPRDIAITIPEGSSSSSIGQILYENGLIRSKLALKLRLKKSDLAMQLKPGDYKLSTGMNLDNIIDELVEGPEQLVVKFTIPEGFEIRQIVDRLEEKELVDRERFLELCSDKKYFEEEFSFLKELDPGQGLEGFLYPATYEVYKDAGEEEIIRRMLTAFNSVYQNELRDKIASTGLSLNEIITLASIIEREGKLDSERPLMSAVFHNRLKKNINLGSCATVQYILGERKPVLSLADTRIKSPYNTYANAGLPPAPIAAAGKPSLIAAVEPADVDYLFFVLTGEDGSHTFTRTNEEHEAAKKNMIRK